MSDQLALLFDPTGAAKRETLAEGAVGQAVLAFFARLAPGEEFHASDLCAWVWQTERTAPESPGRVMRALREQGSIDYEVADRSRSLYRVLKRRTA